MLKTDDKRNYSNYISIIKNELKHIKENWIVFLVCFFISRHSIIGEIFPFALIVLCIYCYLKGPSLAILLTTVLAIISVRFDFVYIIMLIAIFLYFVNFKNGKKSSILVVACYSAAILFFSKNTILLVEGFKLHVFILNLFESIFIFSSIVLINEGLEIYKNIKLGKKTGGNKNKKEKENKESKGKALFPKEKKLRNKEDKIIKVKNFEVKEVSNNVIKLHEIKSQMEAASTKSSDDVENKPLVKRKYSIPIREGKRNSSLNIFSEKAKVKIKEQLLWQNINVKFFEVLPGNDDSFLLSITIKTDKSPEEAEEAIALIVRNVSGVRIKCTERVGASTNYYVLKFKNIKRVRVKTYVATAIKEGSPISGDSYAYAGKGDKYYTILCDGIGSGEEAFKESTAAVDMLSRFLYTDFTEEQIIKTLNSLLMLKFDVERYVTLDMQIIDYSAKEVRMYKAGAAPSYVISGGTIERIVGKSLPVGILDNFEYNSFKRVIRKGDMIIMISDGIIDSINMDEKKSLDKYLHMIMNKDPQTMANSILSYALRGRDTIMDDMTVLITKIG